MAAAESVLDAMLSPPAESRLWTENAVRNGGWHVPGFSPEQDE